MKRTILLALVLLLAIAMGAGCTSTYAEEQWVKEDTVKYAEQHIGYKLLPDVEDHDLRFGTPGKIGEDTRVYRIGGTVYRAADGRGYDVHAIFTAKSVSGGNTEIEMTSMTIDGVRVV
jgi:hypothetical protein